MERRYTPDTPKRAIQSELGTETIQDSSQKAENGNGTGFQKETNYRQKPDCIKSGTIECGEEPRTDRALELAGEAQLDQKEIAKSRVREEASAINRKVQSQELQSKSQSGGGEPSATGLQKGKHPKQGRN
jgi:hypothetical protein